VLNCASPPTTATTSPGCWSTTIAHPDFAWLAQRPADWRERTDDWPATRYEAKAARRRPHAGFSAISSAGRAAEASMGAAAAKL